MEQNPRTWKNKTKLDKQVISREIETIKTKALSKSVRILRIVLKNTWCHSNSNEELVRAGIVVGVLPGDTQAAYLFIIYLDYMLRTSIDLLKKKPASHWQKNKRSRRYPAQTITDVDYTDDILLANTPTLAESLIHSLKQVAMASTWTLTEQNRWALSRGDISTLNGDPLKLVDKFIYLGSSVSSTEIDINTRLAKAWTAIDRLSIIWKSDLTDKMKRSFFQEAVISKLL